MIAIKDGQKIGEIDVGVSDGETENTKIEKKVKIVARLRLWKNLTLNKYLGSRAGSGNMAWPLHLRVFIFFFLTDAFSHDHGHDRDTEPDPY